MFPFQTRIGPLALLTKCRLTVLKEDANMIMGNTTYRFQKPNKWGV